MTVYRRHIFVCENNRDNGEPCCASGQAAIDGGAVKYMRQALKAAQMHGKGRVRVNRAGCFDRCQEGPMLVIYPDGRWYRYQTAADLQEIIEQDILGGQPVDRLRA